MEFIKKNKKILYIALVLIVVGIIFLLNNSYAYFEEKVEGSCVSLEVGSLVHTLKSKITLGSGESTKIDVVVSNVDNVASKYQLVYSSSDDLTDIVVGYSPDSTDLPYGDLAKDEEKYVTIIVQNNSDTEKTVYIDVRGGLPNNSVEDITLEDGESRINEEIEEPKIPISEILNLESKVDTASTISFASISSETNGRGIYKYQEDGEDIYYWRGAVTDNHVIFAGYCWEMVRTTKTGGVKMIYDGVPVDGKCTNTGAESQFENTSAFNPSYTEKTYFGYMYGLTGITTDGNRCIKLNSDGTAAETGTETTESECVANGGKWTTTAYGATYANVVNSTIKRVIDAWFSTSALNTEENLAKIEDAVYCNDRSTTSSGIGSSYSFYGSYVRLTENKTPSLDCDLSNDRFTVKEENGNGELTYPVGLLTADEIALAGGVDNTTNSDYYLYTGSTYWTLSPGVFWGLPAAHGIVTTSDGMLYHTSIGSSGRPSGPVVSYSYGVRPVISLAPGTTFKNGTNGTETNPYVVE